MNPLVNTLRGFGRTKLALMAIVAIALIGVFAMVALRVASPALTPLFSNLSPEDSAKIVTELGKLAVPYELVDNGAIVMVPNERVLRLRMSMAEQGIPSNGSVVGYEVFDKPDTFGSSSVVMNINMIRAMEGELARTISSFNQVESARVHLVMPKREVFEKDKNDTSASVALKLRGGQELTKHEIAAVTHFVAAAVPGLKVARITVVDSYGRLLARGDGDEGIGATAAVADDYRASYENRTRLMIEELVEKIVGPGKVKVQVAADMNFDRVVTDSEKFDPEGQVARSVQSTNEKDDSSEAAKGDNVSVANNIPGAAGAAGGAGNNKRATEKTDETTNYEISKTVQKHIKEGGTVNRMSVAVLVDGLYTTDADDKKTYAPRSEEELKRIESLVKSAVLFDEKRGDSVQVVNMQFTRVDEADEQSSIFDTFKHELQGIIQTVIIAGVAILAIMVVLRPAITYLQKTSAMMAERAAAAEAAGVARGAAGQLPGIAALDPTAMLAAAAGALPPGAVGGGGGGGQPEEEEEDSLIDLQNVRGRIRSSTLRKVVEIVDKNPNEAMGVMRQWMMKEAT